MPQSFEPRHDILPAPQREIWPFLGSTAAPSFVLYGGTAVALRLGHRRSLDFDFFSAEALDRKALESFPVMRDARPIQEDRNTFVASIPMPSGEVRLSFYGGIGIGHLNEPSPTADTGLWIASLDDLMATKLKAILDRAEAKDYLDIAAMLAAGVALEVGLGAFAAMYRRDPALPLRALGFFADGDLATLPSADQDRLRAARDRVTDVPSVLLKPGLRSS